MTVERLLDEADRVLVAAGAGLSAAAGYDYTDTRRFAELFPVLHRMGLRARYQLIGLPLPPRLLWGYWSVHVDDIRFGPAPNPMYARLREVIGARDNFVLTSNVDGLFARNGFTDVWSPQGDYGRYQCETPCTRETWDSRPIVEAALAGLDPETGEASAVPTCPRCAGPVFLNVHKGPEYVADHYAPDGQRLREWVNRPGDLLVVEIGAGYSTPTVIRRPVESLVRGLPRARLVRINRDHAEVPADLAERSVSVRADVAEVLGLP
ncbi:NAD-dependent protein deacetylase of SIR2 family [Nocardia sp. NRRL S-836]|uniref:NAD-dependent protein deacetylase of SIR2 family n=1 Tax=Nocardia sp. NRRL S-836 TaxID=1519492 RepID=UPI0006AF2901|nr:NAD-dependent protein deacetylase of SIR2 family [Nocardia sp. NRRL S-836]KOV85371.1 NAD-dependent protein deacetylase of SIR2 family [Nocardia sp. NRRL S-836]